MLMMNDPVAKVSDWADNLITKRFEISNSKNDLAITGNGFFIAIIK